MDYEHLTQEGNYPRRFQYFLDFLRISGTLEEQDKRFVLKARENQVGSRKPYVIHRLSEGKN
jgi:hypothetical protein